MAKKEILTEKFPEIPNINYLKKLRSNILKKGKKVTQYEFSLGGIIEFNTPVLQFLLSVKKYALANNIQYIIKDISEEGKKLLSLFDCKLIEGDKND